MPDITWNTDNTISIEPPKKPKKMTGTRFAAVLGRNKWKTDFQMWCEITKAYELPFEGTKYTEAGKTIEPKQIAYMRQFSDNVVDPTQVFGPNPFKTTYGNFFADKHNILGGMWDALLMDEDDPDKVAAVFEMKSTKRSEDWADDVPEDYALQASLYAWLLDCDDVIMVATFLKEEDYDHLDDLVVDESNTVQIEFAVSERYPTFEEDYVEPALQWWRDYIETGNSPVFDEKADAEYLKGLRNISLNPTTDIDALLEELAELEGKVGAASALVATEEKRIKVIKDQLKKYALETIGDSDTATIEGHGVTCTLSKTTAMKVDEKAMKADGIYEKYAKPTESSRFTVKLAK